MNATDDDCTWLDDTLNTLDLPGHAEYVGPGEAIEVVLLTHRFVYASGSKADTGECYYEVCRTLDDARSCAYHDTNGPGGCYPVAILDLDARTVQPVTVTVTFGDPEVVA